MACSRPSTTDCPPPSTQSVEAPAVETAPEPVPVPVPGSPEALTVTADDGHTLRLWSLLPPDASPPEEPAPGESAGEDTKDRRAVLLLHGRTWSGLPDFDLRVGDDASLSLMYTLADQGIAAYALDLRGYGGTERDASGWLEPERAAADLLAALRFVAEAEGEAPDLLGWSMGSLVSLLALQTEPDAARSLVLYGYPRDLDARLLPLPEEAKAEPPRVPTTQEAAASDFITEGTISPEALAAYVEASLAADPVRVDWRAMHQFNALDAEQLNTPTLVIHGEHDPIARPLWQAKLFTRMTKLGDRQWVVIPNADHAAHLEQPEPFLRALLAFWRG